MKKTSKPKSPANKSPKAMHWLWRWLVLVLLAGLSLEVFFIGRIALMAVVDPQSTTFQRSEAWRLATDKDHLRWRQQWVDYHQISDHLKRCLLYTSDAADE